MLAGKLTTATAAALEDHLSHCPACQQELERLSGAQEPFSQVVRHIDQAEPPSDSAFWRALEAVEAEGMKTVAQLPRSRQRSTNGQSEQPASPSRLDFLQPPQVPGDLGQIGSFRILRVIGRGGMGVVLHGFDPSLSRDIAVKVLDPHLAGNEAARARFCREARAAAAVTHENLVAVHQVDEDPVSGLPYLIMQLVQGESLEQRLNRVGRLNVEEVARIGMQAAAGLAAAHAGGLIHRDIKPGNILLEKGTDRVKLTDFGLARAAEDVKLTRTGFVAGTPLYMAPEQARGEEVDARADLFSLGTVLYECAAGKPPFDGKTPLVVLRRVADDAHTPLHREVPDAPLWLSQAIDRLLAKDPNQRFQTAKEVAEHFAEKLASLHRLSPLEVAQEACGGSLVRRISSRTRWMRSLDRLSGLLRRAAPWAAGILIGAVAVAVGTHFTSPRREGTPAPPPASAEPQLPPWMTWAQQTLAPVFSWLQSIQPPAIAEGPEHMVSGPEPIAVLSDTKSGPIWVLDFSPDHTIVATGHESGDVKFWDIRDSALRGQLAPLEGTVWSARFSRDGNYLVTASDDGRAIVWEMMTFSIVKNLPHPTSVKAAAFSPDGRKVATGDRASTLRVWDLETQIPLQLRGHRGPIHSVTFSPDGKFLASAGSDRSVKIWRIDPDRLIPVRTLDHDAPVYCVSYSPDGTRVASAALDGMVRIWDVRSGGLLHPIRAHRADAWSVSFSADGASLASAGIDGTVKIWETYSGRERLTLRLAPESPLHACRFSREGFLLGAAGRNGTVRVWDLTHEIHK